MLIKEMTYLGCRKETEEETMTLDGGTKNPKLNLTFLNIWHAVPDFALLIYIQLIVDSPRTLFLFVLVRY